MGKSIVIIAGDALPSGSYSLRGKRGGGSIGRFFGGDRIDLRRQVAEVVLLDDATAKRMLGSALWGWLGGKLVGGAGLLAGALAGGNQRKVLFALRLVDGKTAIAEADGDTWRELLTSCAEVFRRGS